MHEENDSGECQQDPEHDCGDDCNIWPTSTRALENVSCLLRQFFDIQCQGRWVYESDIPLELNSRHAKLMWDVLASSREESVQFDVAF